MTQSDTSDAATGKSIRKDDPFRIGADRLEALIGIQKELLDSFQKVHRERLARAMEETKLASEFAEKVSGARSILDILAVFQTWINQRLELFAEDGRKFLDDSQKISNAAVRLLSHGGENGGQRS